MIICAFVLIKKTRTDFAEETLFIKRYNKDTIEKIEYDLRVFFDIQYNKGWRLLNMKVFRG